MFAATERRQVTKNDYSRTRTTTGQFMGNKFSEGTVDETSDKRRQLSGDTADGAAVRFYRHGTDGMGNGDCIYGMLVDNRVRQRQ